VIAIDGKESMAPMTVSLAEGAPRGVSAWATNHRRKMLAQAKVPR